ncbi:MAG: hypothetical protein WBI07_19225 [Mobilitalea sp.]
MMINQMSNALKIILLGISFLIVCTVCIIAIKASNEGRDLTNLGTRQIKAAAEGQSDIAVTAYDGNSLFGSDLTVLLQDTIEQKDYLSVVVVTLEGSRTDYNYVYNINNSSISEGGVKILEENKAKGTYINPSGEFMGSVKRDVNKNCICIWYEQID